MFHYLLSTAKPHHIYEIFNDYTFKKYDEVSSYKIGGKAFINQINGYKEVCSYLKNLTYPQLNFSFMYNINLLLYILFFISCTYSIKRYNVL